MDSLPGDGPHLRKKAEFFSHLRSNHDLTVMALGEKFDRFATYFRSAGYDIQEYHLRFIYASREDVDVSYSDRYAETLTVLSHPHLQYFVSLVKTIKRSARFEILKFLDISLANLGVAQSGTQSHAFPAMLLPEIPSGFPKGHKLVSFLVDPATLLERAYVLRADSWRDREALYQRLLVKNKIASMRKYLVDERRVFVNNIIVTLKSDAVYEPSDTRDLNAPQAAAWFSTGTLTIPKQFDAIGIIDGQHRVYAYHEGDDQHDQAIGKLRVKQHLLVTGIIYPRAIKAGEAEAFEAKLFLEINDKQNRVKGDLKQAIETLVNPCSDVAIAKAVLQRLGATSPLVGILAIHFFDSGKLRTTSIVSYGLRHIVGLQQPVSFINKWTHASKDNLLAKCDRSLLEAYVTFCGTELNQFISAFKASQDTALWTTDLNRSRVLTTTTINGLIFCMRLLLEHDKLGDFQYYQSGFKNLKIDFRPKQFKYKSSNWRKLGEEIYAQCFANRKP